MVFFFKQKTAYEMRISDWSSDVCSSDLAVRAPSLGDPPVRSPRLLGWPGATIRADGRWPVEARPCDAGAAALERREHDPEDPMPHATTNGIELYHEVSGRSDGPALLLSNSLSSNLHMWDPQIDRKSTRLNSRHSCA